MARPSLLFLSQTLPYPPDGGVKIRTYHILRMLAAEFDTTALCFYRWKGGAFQEDIEASVAALGEMAAVKAFPIPQEHNRSRLVWDHLRSIVTRRPYTVFSYESAHYRAELSELLETRSFDLVHADSLDMSGYFPAVDGLPLVCVHHDAQSTLLSRRADHETSPWKRAYIRAQAKLMEKEERTWCPDVALNVTVSEVDKAVLSAVAPGAEFDVVPNGVDVEFFRPDGRRNDQEGVVFVGGTTWFPNLDALRYFRGDILPYLRQRGVRGPITWVGRATEKEARDFGDRDGITLTGYVPDIRPYVHAAACYVVPIRAGSGTRIKILDAWAMGKAVVSTSVGCEGLQAEDGRNILVRDTPEEFADAIVMVLNDPALRDRLGEEGRRTAVDHYSWDAIGKRMVARYRSLL